MHATEKFFHLWQRLWRSQVSVGLGTQRDDAPDAPACLVHTCTPISLVRARILAVVRGAQRDAAPAVVQSPLHARLFGRGSHLALLPDQRDDAPDAPACLVHTCTPISLVGLSPLLWLWLWLRAQRFARSFVQRYLLKGALGWCVSDTGAFLDSERFLNRHPKHRRQKLPLSSSPLPPTATPAACVAGRRF